MEKDAEKAKWIKYLNDFAYEQDGEYGRGRITPEDVYEKIIQARSEGYENGKDEYRKSKWVDVIWNEAIEAASNVLPSLDECQMWFQYLEIPRKATESSRHYFKKIITESINKLKRG